LIGFAARAGRSPITLARVRPEAARKDRRERWRNGFASIYAAMLRRSGCVFTPGWLMTAIELHGVNLALGSGRARVHILKDVELAIARGEAVGLVGPSGSGKSTLLMTLAGLERPDAGTIRVLGERHQDRKSVV